MIKKTDRIIAGIRKQQTRYFKRSLKLDTELSKTKEQAYALDTKNGNNLWADAISKEMGQSGI